MRTLALSMPEAEESSHFGQPDFRVKGKIFADLSPDGKLGTLKLGPELQAMILDAKPDVFFAAAGYWGRQGWTRVHLSKVELGALRGLVEEAWRLIAPKRLINSTSDQPKLRAKKPRAAANRKSPARKRR